MRALSDATAAMLKPIAGLRPTDRLELDCDKEFKSFIARITTSDPTQHFPSNAATRMWLSRVPERKQLEHPANSWRFAATDYTAEIIRAIWPEDQIVWADEKAFVLYQQLLLTTTSQDANAETYAAFKATGELPAANGHPLEVHPEFTLAPYQKCASAIGLASAGYGLFMEQGTGKTPVVIAEVCSLAAGRDWREPLRVLVVCPKNVRLNWVREFERFATQPGKIDVVRGGPIKRITAMIRGLVPEDGCKYAVCVMSYEGMTKSLDAMTHVLDEIGDGKWDMVVLDEAHYIKSPKTDRTRAAWKLRDIARRRRVLTGTPVGNSPLDLYSLFEFMGEGWSGFRSWESFRQFYGVFKEVEGDAYQKLVGVQNMPFMKERLARLSFIIRKDEALPDLPDKVYDVDEVEMTGEQAEVYERVATELLAEIEEELDQADNKAITVNNILTKLLRLAQIASGYAKYDPTTDSSTFEQLDKGVVEFFSPDPKLERLVEILKEKNENQKTIVWSCFVPCIKVISERLRAEGMDHVVFYGGSSDAEREDAEHRFNCDPACRVFVGNPAAGGTGLNLLGYPPHGGEGCPTNCDHAIYYAQDWSYIKRSQSEDRCHRRGTRANVRITDLVVPETVDEDIRVRVLKKKMSAMELTDIREVLGAVLATLRGRRESED